MRNVNDIIRKMSYISIFGILTECILIRTYDVVGRKLNSMGGSLYLELAIVSRSRAECKMMMMMKTRLVYSTEEPNNYNETGSIEFDDAHRIYCVVYERLIRLI